MKKILALFIILCFYENVAFALSIYDSISEITKNPYSNAENPSDAIIKQQMEENERKKRNSQQIKFYEAWVTDINAGKGHVTYTLNMYMPTQRGPILFKNRRDYSCSQNKEALLWGEATYLYNGETIDYTSLMDKTKLRKYAPLDEHSFETIQQITPYCQ